MILLISFCTLTTLFAASWIIAAKIRNASIVDTLWALSLTIPITIYLIAFEGNITRDLLISAMAFTWSARLGIHLVKRIYKDHPKEDKRYAMLRDKWGEHAQRNFLIIFLINGLLVFLLSLPFYYAAQATHPISLLEWIGLTIFLIGLTGESIADYQLKQFRKSNHNPTTGKVCRIGLWNYSRHPNYFFESVIWLGIYLFCAASPGGIYAIHAPILITFLLVKITGIPPLERDLLESKGDAYREYQQSTNVFIPWFKK